MSNATGKGIEPPNDQPEHRDGAPGREAEQTSDSDRTSHGGTGPEEKAEGEADRVLAPGTEPDFKALFREGECICEPMTGCPVHWPPEPLAVKVVKPRAAYNPDGIIPVVTLTREQMLERYPDPAPQKCKWCGRSYNHRYVRFCLSRPGDIRCEP